MSKEILGIEISIHTTKIVQVKNGKCIKFVELETPENIMTSEGLIAYEAMADVLKEKLQEEKIRTKNVALILPDANVYLHKVVMPIMNEKQLLVNLPYEFHDMVQGNKEQYAYDYVVTEIIKENDEPKEMELLAAAVDKKVIEEFKEMFKRINLRLVRLEPRELALASFMRNYGLDTGDKLLLHFGDVSTTLDMYRNGIYDTSRTIELGLEGIIDEASNLLNCDPHVAINRMLTSDKNVLEEEPMKEIYSRIAIEIMRSINYYLYENRDAVIDNVYYYGDGSELKPLLETIQENINLKLVPLQELNTEEDVLLVAPSAYGIALEEE